MHFQINGILLQINSTTNKEQTSAEMEWLLLVKGYIILLHIITRMEIINLILQIES